MLVRNTFPTSLDLLNHEVVLQYSTAPTDSLASWQEWTAIKLVVVGLILPHFTDDNFREIYFQSTELNIHKLYSSSLHRTVSIPYHRLNTIPPPCNTSVSRGSLVRCKKGNWNFPCNNYVPTICRMRHCWTAQRTNTNDGNEHQVQPYQRNDSQLELLS